MSGYVIPVKPRLRAGAAGAPATTDIQVGELAFNANDGVLYTNYTPGGGAQTILKLGGVGFLQSGSAIDGSIIGGTTPAAGSFTTGTFSSTFTLSGLTASTILGLNASKQAVSVTLSNGLTAGAGTLTITPSSILPSAPAAKTAAYTLQQTDNNTTIVFNTASSVAATVPALSAGTAITVAQRGAGKVTLTASGTTITVYPSGATGTAGVGAQVTLYWDTGTTVLAGGAMS